jgi:hypothetical protein
VAVAVLVVLALVFAPDLRATALASVLVLDATEGESISDLVFSRTSLLVESSASMSTSSTLSSLRVREITSSSLTSLFRGFFDGGGGDDANDDGAADDDDDDEEQEDDVFTTTGVGLGFWAGIGTGRLC